MVEARDIRERLEAARDEGMKMIESAADLESLEEARVRALGRKSALSQARAGLGDLSDDDRKEIGRVSTEAQSAIQEALEAKRATLQKGALEERWEREKIDVTLPGNEVPPGALHPLTRTMWEMVDIFIGLGYRVADGPEVELATYLFDALNTPPEHPARSEQDTFYIEGRGEDVCLRTETSPAQIRTMETQPPPIYVVVPGRVYRKEDEDPTHLSQFAQIEGLAVDEGITMADLKGTLEHFAHELFGRDLGIRLRPSFFPFTEPSAELDVECFVCRGKDPQCRTCKGEGWVEMLGCGMVDPFLLEWVGYDPERYTGFAFGMGLERAAAPAYGVADIRDFYNNDVRFLRAFRGQV
jgi:phenylalanyl-tRNA synthetase alpha chain